MNDLIVTVDLDWAPEPAIEETLDFLEEQGVPITVFITHRSARIESRLDKIEVGLHPFFDPTSSHGETISEVVKHVMGLPHNLPAFRCHRFAICNSSRQALSEAGFLISSNVCTDLEIIPPFKDRFGLLEVPIFLEDGGYLWRKHPLKISPELTTSILGKGTKVIIIHPMHFCLNTPNFSYMYDIKQSVTRHEWKNMTKNMLNNLRWNGCGIRDLLIEIIKLAPKKSFLGSLLKPT